MTVSAEIAWKIIIEKVDSTVVDIKTNPITSKKPLWFSISKIRDDLYVEMAKHFKPSSNITGARRISKADFIKVYPYYFRRKNREQVSKMVTNISNNQVYIFGLIKEYVDID